MKSAKETAGFPYYEKNICYIELFTNGEIHQVGCNKNEIEVACRNAREDRSKIYAVWPGNYRSDLFVIDDINALSDAYGLSREKDHIHQIEYRISEYDDGQSRYASVDLEFMCDCKLNYNNIKSIAADFKKQFGWDMATSTGFGCSTHNGKATYTVRIRRSSIKQ